MINCEIEEAANAAVFSITGKVEKIDGDVKPGSPLGAFPEEQPMSQHPFLSSSSHTTQLHYTNSYT